MSVIQLSTTQLQTKLENKERFSLLDVREPFEYEYTHIAGSKLIPLHQVPKRLNEIDASIACVVICHHGIRSQQVANFLVYSGFPDVYNLVGGIEVWARECDSTILRYE